MPRPPQSVQIIAIDPGTTSGICVLTLNPDWLVGKGAASWDGLGAAVLIKYAAQIGRYPKAWDSDADRAEAATNDELAALHLPILAQPMMGGVDDDPQNARSTFAEIIDGLGKAGGGDLTVNDVNEAIQLRQIEGMLENHPRAALVIESFSLRQFNQQPTLLSPERLQHAIKMGEILHGSSGRTPFMQQPVYAKSTATDPRLKRARLYFPGMPHATDAARHAATFARDLRQSESLRAAAFPRHAMFRVKGD